MSTEEEIKKRMLQQKMQASLEEQQVKQAEEMLKKVMSQVLDAKARERLSNLRLVNPEIATQLELYLAQLYQSGQLRHVTEEQLVMILRKLTEKKETKIRRK